MEENTNFENLLNELKILGDESNCENPKNSKLYKDFILKYPVDGLPNIKMEDYCIGRGDKNTFCWWLERGLEPVLGRYMPGTARGHILYFAKDKETDEKKVYKNPRLNNLSDETALKYTLCIQSCIANAAAEETNPQNLLWIDDDQQIYKKAKKDPLMTVGYGRKLRLLSCYNPEITLPISSSSHLGHFLKVLGINEIPPESKPVARMLRLLKFYELAKDAIGGLTTRGFVKALYSERLGLAPPKVKDKADDAGLDESDDARRNAIKPDNEAVAGEPLNQILYGPPGTGKTYATIDEALTILNPDYLNRHRADRAKLKDGFDFLVNEQRVRFVTFHQSFSYEDFVEGLRATTDENTKQLRYEVVDGVFKSICTTAAQAVPLKELIRKGSYASNDAWVLIIDEINRGNISRIFGELITLIEPSKRAGADDARKVELPYSRKPFCIPKNVYLIGTMNTADRSLATMDVALRRRFVFKEMPPRPAILKDVKVGDIPIDTLLTKINQRIEALLDREHCLGHTYFMPLSAKNSNSLPNLAKIFRNQVLPLLQEYFFDDWQKIQWVLNDHRKLNEAYRFVKMNTVDTAALFGNVVNTGRPAQLWCINEDAFICEQSYLGVINHEDAGE